MILHKLHWAVFGVGAALLVAGVVGAARSWNDRGVLIIVGAGLVCLLLALVAHRLIGVTIGKKVGFTLSQEVAQDLRVTGIAGAAATYSFIHTQLAGARELSGVKVKLQDQVVAMVNARAFAEPVDEAEVDRILTSGSPAARVLVFGLLQADPALATMDRLKGGILNSKSGNEQYQALVAVDKHWSAFTPEQQQQLKDWIQEAPYVSEDKDRRELAAKILADDVVATGPGVSPGR